MKDSNVAPTRKGGVKTILLVLIFKQSSATRVGNREQSNVNQTRKTMKKVVLILVSLIGVAGIASASNDFSYTATAGPGTSPSDGEDVFNGNAPVEVWTINQTTGTAGAGFSGSYLGAPFGGAFSGWQIWSSETDGIAGHGGWIDASTAFAGGALAIGQTVSINFEMRAVDPPNEVGVSLLNGSGNAITFGIFGGEPDATYPYTGSGYYYSDAGSSYVSAGSMGYQYQAPFSISFSVTGANTYSAVAGTDSWSGTFSGSLIGMDVFNDGGGNGSDVGFNNLTVVPEPSTWAMLAAGSMAMFGWRRAFRHA
jgi:hypothetical protein